MKAPPKQIKGAFTLDQARAEVLAKLARVGAKGGSLITAATKEPKRSLLEQALATLEAERLIFRDRGAAKPKFLLAEFAPSAATAAIKIEQFAARQYPLLLTAAHLKKAVGKMEHAFLNEAIARLEQGNRFLLKLQTGKSEVYAHADSLRARLGSALATAPAVPPIEPTELRRRYSELVRRTGFPDVEIAALQRLAGTPMPALKAWLETEHRAGRAVFGLGDWSLADDATRAGAIELRGDRYLLVRLDHQP